MRRLTIAAPAHAPAREEACRPTGSRSEHGHWLVCRARSKHCCSEASSHSLHVVCSLIKQRGLRTRAPPGSTAAWGERFRLILRHCKHPWIYRKGELHRTQGKRCQMLHGLPHGPAAQRVLRRAGRQTLPDRAWLASAVGPSWVCQPNQPPDRPRGCCTGRLAQRPTHTISFSSGRGNRQATVKHLRSKAAVVPGTTALAGQSPRPARAAALRQTGQGTSMPRALGSAQSTCGVVEEPAAPWSISERTGTSTCGRWGPFTNQLSTHPHGSEADNGLAAALKRCPHAREKDDGHFLSLRRYRTLPTRTGKRRSRRIYCSKNARTTHTHGERTIGPAYSMEM